MLITVKFLNLKCRIGLHNWEEVDCYELWEKWCKEHGYVNSKGEIPIGRPIGLLRLMPWPLHDFPIEDRVCLRCGKKDYKLFEEKKKIVEEEKRKYDRLKELGKKSTSVLAEYFK